MRCRPRTGVSSAAGSAQAGCVPAADLDRHEARRLDHRRRPGRGAGGGSRRGRSASRRPSRGRPGATRRVEARLVGRLLAQQVGRDRALGEVVDAPPAAALDAHDLADVEQPLDRDLRLRPVPPLGARLRAAEVLRRQRALVAQLRADGVDRRAVDVVPALLARRACAAAGRRTTATPSAAGSTRRATSTRTRRRSSRRARPSPAAPGRAGRTRPARASGRGPRSCRAGPRRARGASRARRRAGPARRSGPARAARSAGPRRR